MSENNYLAITLLVLAVIAVSALTGVIGYNIHPDTKEVIVEKLVEKPVYTDKIVEKEVLIDNNKRTLDKAVAEFLAEVEDEDSLQVCSSDQYDPDQISVSRIYDGYTISVDEDRNGDITTATFEIRLKYTDSDVSEKCYETFDVEVIFEDGEDTILNY